MLCGNYIHIETVKDRGQTDYVKAYAHGADFFEARGITPSFERMDNEDSDHRSRCSTCLRTITAVIWPSEPFAL